MIGWDVLDEQDEEFAKDINGYEVGDTTIVTREQTFIDGSYHRSDIKEEKDEAPFEQAFQEAHLHAEAIIKITAEIMVGCLLIKKIGAEIATLKPAAEDEVATVHVSKKFGVQKGSGVLVVEI